MKRARNRSGNAGTTARRAASIETGAGRPDGSRWAWAAVLLSLVAAAVRAQSATAGLPLLTTLRSAHDMLDEEGGRGYPVHLRAVATYFDPYVDPRRTALFVLDKTGSMFVALPPESTLPIHPGTLLDITGVTGAGDFAPIIDHPRIRVIGAAPLPEDVPRASVARMLTGEDDAQWRKVEGVVHAVRETARDIVLDLDLSDGMVSATTPKEPGVDYARLIDAKVKFHANVAPFYNAFRQLSGAHLYFPSMAEVEVEEPAAADPFGLPARAVNSLLRYEPHLAFRHRVHVRGRVTLYWPGRSLCLQDETEAMCAATDKTTPLDIGDVVDVAGFPAIGGFTPTMTEAIFRRAGSGQPARPLPVTAAQALRGDHDSRLVEMEGELVGRDTTVMEPALTILSDHTLFTAVLPEPTSGDEPVRWLLHGRVRITGICSVQVDARQMAVGAGSAQPASFRILLRSAADVVTIGRPPWWNRDRVLGALGLVALAALGVFAWVLPLRKRVGEQTAAIAIEKERYRSLVENAPDIVLASDLNGNLTSANPTATRLLGYSRAELLERTVWSLLSAGEREGAMAHFQRMLAGESPGPLECWLDTKWGGTLLVEVNASIVYKDGQPVAVQGILRDVTERHRLERQLLQAQKMEAIGRLAGGVAHDFNNLLTVINGYSDMLIRDLPEDDPDRPAIEEIRAAGERAAAFTKQLLAFGRRQISRPRPLDLNAVIRDAAQMLQRLIGEEITLETSLEPALDAVEADPGQIHQVLLNLSINARDAMTDGGVLTIATANARFEAGTAPHGCQAGAYVTLMVADTGVGMDEETMRHLFEPFFTTKPDGFGTGLGLATIYGIVEQSGGSIQVHSEPGKGCRFDIYLPRAEGPVEPATPAAIEAPGPGRELTVLVVEDQQSVRGLAARALRDCGYNVIEAGGGEEALALARTIQDVCQLVVTDVVMPGMSGKDMADELRAIWPEVKVLFMSGYPNEVLLRHGLMDGEIDYLEKPFTPAGLAAKVREVMG